MTDSATSAYFTIIRRYFAIVSVFSLTSDIQRNKEEAVSLKETASWFSFKAGPLFLDLKDQVFFAISFPPRLLTTSKITAASNTRPLTTCCIS